MTFAEIVSNITSTLWGYPTIILLLGTHIYLTIVLRFPQFKILKAIKLSVTKDPDSDGDINQFYALATSLAATIGTGNIIGVATAIALGGPGAIFWCWMTGVLGIATKYAESLLAIKYRVRTSDGTMLGGPMYALERGLNMRWLAILFSLFTVIACFGIGNTVPSNAIATIFAADGCLGEGSVGVSPYISGIVMALLVGLVVIGGLKGVAKVCGTLVPFMAVFYVGGCIAIMVINHDYVWSAIELIVSSAFNPQAIGGGFAGGSIMIVARYGIARGLFSNESGMGSAPIISAAAKSRNPVRQALVSSTGTFWDTVIICAMTGIALVSSVLAHPDITFGDGAQLAQRAFSKIPYVGSYILSFGLVTFAFTTILGWNYYGEKALEYLVGGKGAVIYYRIVWVVMIFVGAIANLPVVWDIADSTNALMAIPNLISLLLLSGVAVNETRKYLWSGNLDKESDDEIPTI